MYDDSKRDLDEERRRFEQEKLDEERRRFEQDKRNFEMYQMNQGNQKKKGGCLRFLLIIIGIFVALIIIGFAISQGNDNTSTNDENDQDSTREEEQELDEEIESEDDEQESDSEDEEIETESGEQEESASEDEDVIDEEDAEDIVSIGQVLELDDIEFTVNEITYSDSVGNYLTSNANDTYLILEVSVTNNQNEAITMNSSYFKIVDGERVFEPESTASTYANQARFDNIGFFLESINPGSSRTALIVFDIAQSIVDSNEKQLQVQSGFWGTKTGIINLD